MLSNDQKNNLVHGRKNWLARTTESHSAFQYELATDCAAHLGLHQVVQTADNPRCNSQHLSRTGRAKDFQVPDCREPEIRQGRDLRIGLRNSSGKLRRCFQHEHSRKKWAPGKVSSQESLVATDSVFTDASLTGLKFEQPVEETELRPVRQRIERVGHTLCSSRGKEALISSFPAREEIRASLPRLLLFEGLDDFVITGDLRVEHFWIYGRVKHSISKIVAHRRVVGKFELRRFEQ